MNFLVIEESKFSYKLGIFLYQPRLINFIHKVKSNKVETHSYLSTAPTLAILLLNLKIL